jgi:hypothetical protein
MVVQRIRQNISNYTRTHVVASAPRGLTNALVSLQYEPPGRSKLSTLTRLESRLLQMGLNTNQMFQPCVLNTYMGARLVSMGELVSTYTLMQHFHQDTHIPTQDLIFTRDGMLDTTRSYERLSTWNRTLPLTTTVCFHLGFFSARMCVPPHWPI